MVKVKCGKCGHVWDYKGKGYYAMCATCRALQRVSDISVKEGDTDD